MRRKTSEQLAVGRRALMKVGSPVRQWLRTLEDKPQGWLTPVRYMAAAASGTVPQYVEVTVAKVMSPYAIVYHHDGRGWMQLWLDTRIVPLFPVGE